MRKRRVRWAWLAPLVEQCALHAQATMRMQALVLAHVHALREFEWSYGLVSYGRHYEPRTPLRCAGGVELDSLDITPLLRPSSMHTELMMTTGRRSSVGHKACTSSYVTARYL